MVTYMNTRNKKWLSSLYFLFKCLDISNSSVSNDKLASVAKSKLIKRYKAEWINALSKIGTIKLENYVHIHCSNIGYVESHILNILKVFL